MNCCAWGSTAYVYRQQWFVVVTKYSDAVIILTLTLFMNWSTARTSLQSQNPGTVPAADAVCNALDSSRRLRLLSRLVRVSRCLQPYLISGFESSQRFTFTRICRGCSSCAGEKQLPLLVL